MARVPGCDGTVAAPGFGGAAGTPGWPGAIGAAGRGSPGTAAGGAAAGAGARLARNLAIRSSSAEFPAANSSASARESAVFSLIRFSMYSGTVSLEYGEIVRVAGSARNQRPQITRSSSSGSRRNCSRTCWITSARFSFDSSNTPCLFSTCPEIASAS
jgi:hypothetical protein